ncbi:hypothetical protein EHQ47_16720 [Leptospira bourretii]|uniref:hypothetical protein n=1 Tax=Leptospira bourretii TaxID=2484962 RepID=UPI001090EB93|nr:hypothetical protein [Leptospira bourretii]TGL19739.1 hypothetical protein EHQ47_16720 [Leptospira bourretii]
MRMPIVLDKQENIENSILVDTKVPTSDIPIYARVTLSENLSKLHIRIEYDSEESKIENIDHGNVSYLIGKITGRIYGLHIIDSSKTTSIEISNLISLLFEQFKEDTRKKNNLTLSISIITEILSKISEDINPLNK